MTVVAFPVELVRWRARHPAEALVEPDPREGCGPCRCCGQTFAWRGYDGLCGWCYEEDRELTA